MPEPLPANSFDVIALPQPHLAYQRCLDLEAHIINQPPPQSSGLSSLICVRLLGYMLLEAPVASGREKVSRAILSCGDNNAALIELGRFYGDRLMRCFRAVKGRTPTVSTHSSRPSFDDFSEMIGYLLKEAPKDHSTAKMSALVRDNNRCVLSQKVDSAQYISNRTLRQHAKQNSLRIALTRCTHIIPGFINTDAEGSQKKDVEAAYASSIWEVLDLFGGVSVSELNGVNIHRLENVLTLDATLHGCFDSLLIWLEPTDTDNTYTVHGLMDLDILLGLPAQVTFTSQDARLPLPGRKYLALHAACCRIAHLSGAAEAFDTIMRDISETLVLAEDGSSAEVLVHALNNALGHGIMAH